MTKKTMEDTSFIFSSENIELKSEGNDFFVEGYISTSDVDLINDVVTKGCLLDMAEQMRKRAIKFDVEHESFRGKSNLERETNKTIIPVAKVEDFLIDKKGLRVRAKLNPHSQRFNEVKGSIEDGFLDAFSIAYVPTNSTFEEKDGLRIRKLDKINLLNVAFTGNPVNTEAKMTNVFAKSLEFMEEKAKAPKRPKPKVPESEYEDEDEDKKKKEEKNNNHISENTIKLQEVKMSEEENKEENQEVVEKESETKDESNEVEESKESEESEAEVKSLKEEVKSLKEISESQAKEIAELKSVVNKPLRKSTVEQKDKSDNFVDKKAQNPLDIIA
jgi:flagellar biosynthesis GTPase FlhF